MMVLNTIKVISWNVNGVSNKVKRYKIISHLRSLDCGIGMLQETHVNQIESLKLKQRWVGQVYSSPGNGASRGTSILISKKVSFQATDIITDKNGRYIIVSGVLQHKKITLVNIYAPNYRQAEFLTSLIPLLSKYIGDPILFGGDLNLVANPLLDRSSRPLPADGALSAALEDLLKMIGVTDCYRCVNPSSREYSFYSKVHNSYSRIDYLFLSNSLIEHVINSEIHNIVISDHAPISVSFSLSFDIHKTKQWRFDNMLVKDKTFVALINERIPEFFKINLNTIGIDGKIVPIQTVWEAFKLTCGGWCRSYSIGKQKERYKKKKQLMMELKKREILHMKDPSNQELKKQVLLTRTEVQSIIHEETSYALYKLRRKHFESGDKAGKLLALRLKQIENNSSITSIYDCGGSMVREQKDINNAFREHYSKLYMSECEYDPKRMDDFLEGTSLPQLNTDEKVFLETELQEREVITAIKALTAGRAPGQDGFSIDFYKCFQDALAPTLTILYQDMIATQSMPCSMNTAVISLIPKPGKDHAQMRNFRPLSLLNNDYKVFAKILAMRLEKVIHSVIHQDQVGFIAGRCASHNMRRLFHVMSEAASLQHPAVAISIDAEAAFDRIEWAYLFHVLKKYGFGPTCIQWIKALYYKPTACVKTNGLISAPFQLFRSTRQGCPASPVIFTLALEPLACAIRANHNITGISLYNHDFKTNLYADDILLTLTKPDQSIPHLLEVIKNFGLFSGYKVNWSKSEAIPLNCRTFQSHLSAAPIVWKPQGMRYLGVNIVSPIEKIFEINGPKLLKSIKEDLSRWTGLPLSLWGRAEVLKMNVLPRLAFIISAIPQRIPQTWFKDINKIFTQFLWKEKKPRISLKKLSISRKEGGLGIPDMYLYYLAYNGYYSLSSAYEKKQAGIGDWRWLEQNIVAQNCKDVSLASLWYHPKYNKGINNPLIQFSCEVSKAIHKRLRISGLSLPSCPLWKNQLISAGGKPLCNSQWQNKNITVIGQLLDNGELINFNELKSRFSLNNSNMFQYLQLKSILHSYIDKNISLGNNESMDIKLKDAASGRGTVSKLYKLLNYTFDECNVSIKERWEKDLNVTLTPEQWKLILRRSNYLSKCVRYKVIQMKVLFRSYITPYQLKKMNSSVSDMCWHGCGRIGTLIHQLWECSEVKMFWLRVKECLFSLFDIRLHLCPSACLLGSKIDEVCSKEVQDLIGLAFLSVKRIILMNWKVRKPNCFDVDRWLEDFLDLVSMEQAALFLQEQVSDHTDALSRILTRLKDGENRP